MAQKNLDQPRDGEVAQKPAAGEHGPQRAMVVVVPLEPSEFVMPESSYDFALPLFGETAPPRRI